MYRKSDTEGNEISYISSAIRRPIRAVLYASKIRFDIIGITESKQSMNKNFLTNVKINDYQLQTQPSKISGGGIALYLKKSLGDSVLCIER